MQAEQAEPGGVAQDDHIPEIMKELLNWTNFMASGSVCYSQSSGLHTID